jgi:superfamily I DNA and/or RNA helicase
MGEAGNNYVRHINVRYMDIGSVKLSTEVVNVSSKAATHINITNSSALSTVNAMREDNIRRKAAIIEHAAKAKVPSTVF